ncbi:hypothetical protein MKZ19_11485 [Shouchella clausii]|uniref:Biofilm-forming protein n=1 Tax=Shouchella rhizosphaerae TaxID=866786 RepID=A0ABZ2CSH0_9BACI|nr:MULTISPECIES: hypothetical protein [Shouchella]MDO7268090.1 hypothetical protein [Shouchella clausii]MDO7282534.1 hypothetical protein [Shouchella clausii]MDO7287970.1 hypothetical protein [Shouchella clausii]MDO7302629.1 hypothetical protein [Shouchella clausii]SHL09544.1 hypothetical protein SAMN05192535_1001 [Shouchella rhizosphaerae]
MNDQKQSNNQEDKGEDIVKRQFNESLHQGTSEDDKQKRKQQKKK